MVADHGSYTKNKLQIIFQFLKIFLSSKKKVRSENGRFEIRNLFNGGWLRDNCFLKLVKGFV